MYTWLPAEKAPRINGCRTSLIFSLPNRATIFPSGEIASGSPMAPPVGIIEANRATTVFPRPQRTGSARPCEGREGTGTVETTSSATLAGSEAAGRLERCEVSWATHQTTRSTLKTRSEQRVGCVINRLLWVLEHHPRGNVSTLTVWNQNLAGSCKLNQPRSQLFIPKPGHPTIAVQHIV